MGHMTNAKKELLEHIEDRDVVFVSLVLRRNPPRIIKGTLSEVLPLLNFKYDSGYGGQELYGYIWYADGSWSDRGEYDGSEWWQRQECPSHDVEIDY